MVIVCDCEGPLGQPQGETVRCTRCQRTYPAKEALQILKLLQLAARETDNDGKPANENVRRMALNKAARKMVALKLRAIDEAQLQPATPPPMPPVRPPVYQPSYATTATSTVGFGGSSVEVVFGNVIFRVRVI